jgi:hypothetical protein
VLTGEGNAVASFQHSLLVVTSLWDHLSPKLVHVILVHLWNVLGWSASTSKSAKRSLFIARVLETEVLVSQVFSLLFRRGSEVGRIGVEGGLGEWELLELHPDSIVSTLSQCIAAIWELVGDKVTRWQRLRSAVMPG